MKQQALSLIFLLLLAVAGLAADDDNPGQVQLPLETYMKLLQATQDPSRAPASYALGSARIDVKVSSTEPSTNAEVQVQLGVRVLEDEWALIPVLPSGTPITGATVDGQPVQLLATPHGLMWSTKKSGSYTMNLAYRVDAVRSQTGYTLPVPVPQAAAIQLTAALPGTGLDVAVIPAAGLRQSVSGNATLVSATIPTTTGVQISWRSPSPVSHAMSRATYTGRLAGDTVVWTGALDVELFSDEAITLPLLPRSVTLSDLKVDGKKASILFEGDHFATIVRGGGAHRVLIDFQVPVVRKEGPPQVHLEIPQVPVSRFDLTLPGKKDLTVTPAASVQSQTRGKTTVATVHVPLTHQVSFSWSEAVPEDLEAELRSNASVYHTLYAEEGVLYGRATVQFEVNRGETHVIELAVPENVQVNRVESESGGVADWRIAPADGGEPRKLTVFLDHQLRGQILFDVLYDRSIDTSEAVAVPLFQVLDVQRQRGMLALLASRDLALNPSEEPDGSQLTRIGENQLPPFVREAVDKTIAHTFKYVEVLPSLAVEATPPQPAVGMFDAQVDTLFTLGDVTLTGAASIDIHVKSGGLTELELELPPETNLLNLTTPSLRSYNVSTDDDLQLVTIEFTQEMDGDFKVELNYEQILLDDASDLEVPTIAVRGAEVEQGRIAVEAVSAVEIQPTVAEQLSPLDINALPRQLILRTTNPILLAYKYVYTDAPHRLALNLKRHQVLETQEAVIDRADYRTLFTRDGLFVTTARFMVRNSRKQFLRIDLPEGSEVWSVFVDGKSEHPAVSEGGESGSSVLVKILNATRGFPVDVVYATPGSRIRWLGKLRATLPRPDILVTHSRWDVYLPADMRYGTPSSNMELTTSGHYVTADELNAGLSRLEGSAPPKETIGPLHITVPTSGVQFAFEKLYANQSDQEAWFTVSYASAGGARLGQLANLLGVSLFWLGIWLRLDKDRRRAPAFSVAGLVILIITIGVFHAGVTLPLVVSMLIAIVFLAHRGRPYLERLRGVRAAPES